MTEQVRSALGANIARIRGMRKLTVRELSARLQTLGLRLSPSGVSEIETSRRKVSVDELLVLAIALNASIIDLLTPADGSPLAIADGVEPVHAENVEEWLRGDAVWPPAWLEWRRRHPDEPKMPQDIVDRTMAQIRENLSTASAARREFHRQDLRSELQAIDWLREQTRLALDALEGLEENPPPLRQLADHLTDDLEQVADYVNLLVKRLEKKDSDGG